LDKHPCRQKRIKWCDERGHNGREKQQKRPAQQQNARATQNGEWKKADNRATKESQSEHAGEPKTCLDFYLIDPFI
jgi:hypothetical protein